MTSINDTQFKYETVPSAEDAPPAYDHTKAIFIRDEKRAAVSQQELDLLALGKRKSPNILGIHYKAILLVYTMLVGFFQIMIFTMSLADGYKLTAFSSFVTAMIHVTGFSALLLEKHKLLKGFLVVYTMHFLMDTMFSGYGMLMLWSPSFCRDFASSVNGFSYQKCKANLGSLRAAGSTIMAGQVIWEATVLHMFRKVFEHEEKMMNPKETKPKTTSLLLV